MHALSFVTRLIQNAVASLKTPDRQLLPHFHPRVTLDTVDWSTSEHYLVIEVSYFCLDISRLVLALYLVQSEVALRSIHISLISLFRQQIN